MVQIAPGILGITNHGIAEGAPEILGLLHLSSIRRSGHIHHACLNSFGGITGAIQLSFVLIHRVRTFRTKELQGVIAEHIRVGENLVIGKVLLVLVDCKVGIALDGCSSTIAPCNGAIQEAFQLESVVI